MQHSVSRRKLNFSVLGSLVVASGALAAWATVKLAGTKTGAALALTSIFGPVCFYLAVTAPLIFPFTLYAILAPFDNLLSLPEFGTLTKLVGAMTGGVLVVYLVRTRLAMAPPLPLLLWGALAVWMAASAFWAIDDTLVLQMLPTALELVVLYAVVAIYPSTRRDLYYVLAAILVGGVAAAAYGAYLFHSGNGVEGNRLYVGLNTAMKSQSSGEGVIDPNKFASSLLLPMALSVVYTLNSRAMWAKLVFAAVWLVLLVGVGISGSRGAAVATIAMLLYLFIRGPWKVGMIAMALVGAIGPVLSRGSLVTRFNDVVSQGGSGRLDIWKLGLQAIRDHWLLGAGYNNFTQATSQAFLLVSQRFNTKFQVGSHDLIIGTMAELGLPGIVLTIWAWVATFRLLRVIPSEDEDFPLRLALEAAMVGLFISALFLDIMATKYAWLAFMAVTLCYNTYCRRMKCAPSSFTTLLRTSARTKSPASLKRCGTAG